MHRAYICGSVRASCHEKSFEIIIAAWSSLWGKIALRSYSVHGEVTFYPGLCEGQWFAIQVLVWCSGSTLCGPVLYHPDPCWGEVARLPGRCVENRLSNILHNLIIPEIFKKRLTEYGESFNVWNVYWLGTCLCWSLSLDFEGLLQQETI